MEARGGVEFEDVRVGTGEAATRLHIARVSLAITLHRGEAVEEPSVCDVDLRRREEIAGIRYAVEGMRIGGIRRAKVPPHLGYGPSGIPGVIPADALLLCTIGLLSLSPSHPIPPKLKQVRERKAQEKLDD